MLKLNKALYAFYSLKQAPRKWNEILVKLFKEFKYEQLKTDNCVFQNGHLIMVVYVDDLAILSKDESKIEEFKRNINKRFNTEDLGMSRNIIRMTVENLNDGRLLKNQKTYIDKIIDKVNVNNTKMTDISIQPYHQLTLELKDQSEVLREKVDITKYREVIGSLIYLMTCTRPDISYSVGLLSRFMQEPKE